MAGFSYITLPQNINVGRALRKMMSLVKALLKLPKPPTQLAGIATVHAVGGPDLVLDNSGQYDIAGNTLVGAGLLTRGLDWHLGRYDPPIMSDRSTSQLVQAMASFGGSSAAGESLIAAPLSADTSQQMFLTTPHA
jgi:hypothetical protein